MALSTLGPPHTPPEKTHRQPHPALGYDGIGGFPPTREPRRGGSRRKFKKGNSPMSANGVDYYEVLQVSDAAEPETINRVYRIFAQRYHPDNRETGNEARFREITEAYQILSNPEKRARYDATSQKRRKDRWRLVSAGPESENDFEMEQVVRLTVLEVLYTKRR